MWSTHKFYTLAFVRWILCQKAYSLESTHTRTHPYNWLNIQMMMSSSSSPRTEKNVDVRLNFHFVRLVYRNFVPTETTLEWRCSSSFVGLMRLGEMSRAERSACQQYEVLSLSQSNQIAKRKYKQWIDHGENKCNRTRARCSSSGRTSGDSRWRKFPNLLFYLFLILFYFFIFFPSRWVDLIDPYSKRAASLTDCLPADDIHCLPCVLCIFILIFFSRYRLYIIFICLCIFFEQVFNMQTLNYT